MPGLPVHHQLLEFTQTHVHSFQTRLLMAQSLEEWNWVIPQAHNCDLLKCFFKGYLELVGKKVVLNTSVTMWPFADMRIVTGMCITHFVIRVYVCGCVGVYIYMYIYVYILFSHKGMAKSFVTPWTVAYQAPLSMQFSRQEYWSGLPFPSAGNLPDPAIKPVSPTLQADSLPLSHQGACVCVCVCV